MAFEFTDAFIENLQLDIQNQNDAAITKLFKD